MCRDLEAGIHVPNSRHCECLNMAAAKSTQQRSSNTESGDSSVMLIVLNFILRALTALRQERNMIGFDCSVENILERGKTRLLQQFRIEKTRGWSQVKV